LPGLVGKRRAVDYAGTGDAGVDLERDSAEGEREFSSVLPRPPAKLGYYRMQR